MRNGRKAFALILAAAMCCSGFSVSAAPAVAENPWNGKTVTAVTEENGTYQISDAAELAWVAQEVKEGNHFAGKTVELTNDIDLNGQQWTPIGTTAWVDGDFAGVHAFEGTFDGNDYTISGLYAENADGGVALFGYATGTIQDLTIEGEIIGASYTAGLVAYGSGTISGVTNEATVTVAADSNCVGGILAEACGDVKIYDCHNNADITNGGGSAEKSTGRVGGIVGRIESGTSSIINCSNTGDITAYQYVAGIIGGCFGNVTIKACYNTGDITGISFGKEYNAGIAGKLQNGTIDSCYNWGTLYARPWGNGHIRAVGGIAGCEENHEEGTAITNCYNIGTLDLDTSKMQTGKYIYLTGAISGGNNSDGNTMGYEDCFYLDGCIPSQDPNHKSYKWWNSAFQADSALYDTADIVAFDEYDLQSEFVLEALGSYFVENPEGGYPLLYWQVEGNEEPDLLTYEVRSVVSGGTASVNICKEAEEESKVTFTVTDIQDGKQIKSVTAIDVAGIPISVSKEDGVYSFQMPSRGVKVTVTLENVVSKDAKAYLITLPTGMDAIWDVQVDSTNYDAEKGMIDAGASVTIKVSKNSDALTTSFNGIIVKTDQKTLETTEENTAYRSGSKYYAEYTFTMPEEEVEVSVDVSYVDFKVYVEENGEKTLAATYTRQDMETLSKENGIGYYSGWGTETDPFIGLAEQYITLEQLLTGAGVVFDEGDTLMVAAVDSYELPYTYESLIGEERYYYADILEKESAATDKKAFAPAFVLKGNMIDNEEGFSTASCDTLNAYRFVYGQSEEELKGAIKINNAMPKCIVGITVVKGDAETEFSVERLSGKSRYETAIKTADELKAALGVDEFDTVIVATGENFADALSGSYLATVKEAPILLISDSKADEVKAYIKENLSANGTVYVLGGTGAVSDQAVAGLNNVIRLSGKSRYETNIRILKEAGVTGGDEILVATGENFADSLSASAVEKPILLVNNTLSADQKAYLKELSESQYIIVGGEGAVSKEVAADLAAYDTDKEMERISGKSRYETSVEVAEYFFDDVDTVITASAMNYPDGLCGGPLAAALDAPLILTYESKELAAIDYVTAQTLKKGIVLGGTGAISDETVVIIFNR